MVRREAPFGESATNYLAAGFFGALDLGRRIIDAAKARIPDDFGARLRAAFNQEEPFVYERRPTGAIEAEVDVAPVAGQVAISTSRPPEGAVVRSQPLST